MPKPVQAAITLGCTVVLLLLLLMARPFLVASEALDALFGVPPKWTQVEDVYKNSYTQEVTRGDDPVGSLQVLAGFWGSRPNDTRVLFVGNSQMHVISLARGEARPTGIEKTYVDQIADRLTMDSPQIRTYRFSTSGMSYPEVLWELLYMTGKPELHPDAMVLQLNYQAFWTGGIRESLLGLLDDEAFRRRIETAASANKAYSAEFQDALHRYEDSKSTRVAARTANNGVAATFSASATPGYAIETAVRSVLDRSVLFRGRRDHKNDIADFLYRCRLYFLRLKPSTARSVTGARLFISRAAVEDVVKLAHEEKVQLFLFSAPVNPLVSLYRTPDDRASYQEFVAKVAAENGGPLYDFEDTITADHWGNLLNGPDPLHMGRAAHALMAQEMYAKIPLNQIKGTR
ncbi:MAG TPA: hypothetical protein VK578_06595 [Edaphobacter sp.]|jgi:hypothetical protein|nr:hypothetical protein [Edaphobacter sp.]